MISDDPKFIKLNLLSYKLFLMEMTVGNWYLVFTQATITCLGYDQVKSFISITLKKISTDHEESYHVKEIFK